MFHHRLNGPAGLLALSLFFFSCSSDPGSKVPGGTVNTTPATHSDVPATPPEPVFNQEGVLEFFQPDGSKSLMRLNIEIAHDADERQQGLMWRKKMQDDQGMLFVFDYPEPQSFWMRNTYIPLDMIFVNEKFEVVTVLKNVPVLNDDPRPSTRPAQYVVEINAGLADKHHIQPGSIVSWADFVSNSQFGKNPVQTF